MYPKSKLPPEIMKIILQYADKNTLLTFREIRGYEFDALDLLAQPAYAGLSDQVKALLPYEAALELIHERDIPKFMHKHYSTENGRAALPPQVLVALGQACHELLSKVEKPEVRPATIPILSPEALIQEDATRLREMGQITCGHGLGNLTFLMTPLYFMMISDLLAVFAEELPYDFDRRVLRIAAGILIPIIILGLYIPLTEPPTVSPLRQDARMLDAPDAPTESYREWLFQLSDDLRSGEGRFLDLPNMEARATDTFYQKMKLVQTVALVPPILYGFIFQPWTFTGLILPKSQFNNWLYPSTPLEVRLHDHNEGFEYQILDDLTPGNLKWLTMVGMFSLWGSTIFLTYRNEAFREWIDEHTYSTQDYTRGSIAVAAGNTVYLSLCIMFHLAPKIGEKIESTTRGIMHSWRRRNAPAGNEGDLEIGTNANMRLLN